MQQSGIVRRLVNLLTASVIFSGSATTSCSAPGGHARPPATGEPQATETTPRAAVSTQASDGVRDKTGEGDPFDAGARRDVVERLARELEAVYVAPELGAKLGASLREKLQSDAYVKATSAAMLAALLTGELQAASKDKHLMVFSSAEPPPTPMAGPPPPELVEELRKAHGGIEKVEILEGNVGYLALWGVPILEGAREAVADAFALLHDTRALILDNRRNKGGDPRTVALYLSYLTEGEPFVFNEIHWREGARVEEYATTDLGPLSYGAHKPVYVLASPVTFSGGEGLTYHLQAMKRAVVVGEVTAGGARRAQSRSLGHDFYAMIPHAEARSTITGRNWEGVGVQPDIRVASEQALEEALRAIAGTAHTRRTR